MKKICVEVSDTVYRLLEVIARGEDGQTVEGVVHALIDHAAQGVYRPYSWERPWLTQIFGDEWQSYLEPGDPYGREMDAPIFQRPRRGSLR